VADKQRLAALEQAAASNDKIKAMAKGPGRLTELMSRVNRAIYERHAADENAPTNRSNQYPTPTDRSTARSRVDQS